MKDRAPLDCVPTTLLRTTATCQVRRLLSMRNQGQLLNRCAASDPLLEEPLSPVFYNSIYGEDYGDSYGLLPPCEPVPSDSITQSTNVHCGSPVIVPDAPDVTNEDVVEGTSDGVAKDKTIVDEVRV